MTFKRPEISIALRLLLLFALLYAAERAFEHARYGLLGWRCCCSGWRYGS
ncbi:hypothetical protein [Hymenobacter sp. DG25B]|nr:hypothetical protein [Hymenobacter sp. DG25B]